MTHYADGTEALVGDLVAPAPGTDTLGRVLGEVLHINPGADSCNATAVFLADPIAPRGAIYGHAPMVVARPIPYGPAVLRALDMSTVTLSDLVLVSRMVREIRPAPDAA